VEFIIIFDILSSHTKRPAQGKKDLQNHRSQENPEGYEIQAELLWHDEKDREDQHLKG